MLNERHDRQPHFRLGCVLRQLEDANAARACWLECRELDLELGVIGGLVPQYLGELALAT